MSMKELIKTDFGKRGLTQREYAALFGEDPSQVSRWLSGDRKPSKLVLAMLQFRTEELQALHAKKDMILSELTEKYKSPDDMKTEQIHESFKKIVKPVTAFIREFCDPNTTAIINSEHADIFVKK